MAKSVLDIIIKVSKEGGADTETIKGLVSVKSSILDAAAVAGTFVAAGYTVKKVLDETVGTLVSYADEVRHVQNATGASAEDSSKLLKILDDQKISYEQLEKAVAKNAKTYDYTVTGIANMSEAYLKLTNTQDRADFMQARFGKQWVDFVPIMQQGKQAILDQAAAVSGGLVLTQKAMDETRQYERALNDWNDAVKSVKVSVGEQLLPTLTNMLKIQDDSRRAAELAAKDGVNLVNATREQRDHYTDLARAERDAQAATLDQAKATDTATQAAADNTAALKEQSAAHQSMLGLITNIASENQKYADSQTTLTFEMQANRAEAAKLYPWQKTQLDELNSKYADMKTTYEQNAEAHKAAMGKIQFDLLVTKLSVDGITESESKTIERAGIMFGVFDQQSVDSAANFDKVNQAVANGTIRVEDMQKAIDLLPTSKNIDIAINTIVKEQGYNNPMINVPGAPRKYAQGGISTGPTSGHMEILHGIEAVIPLQNGSVPVQMLGSNVTSAGGGNYYINLTIASPLTIMDEQSAHNTLLPFIIEGVRKAKAQGAIK
jgi:hypothetical protein